MEELFLQIKTMTWSRPEIVYFASDCTLCVFLLAICHISKSLDTIYSVSKQQAAFSKGPPGL